jgi:transposase
MEKEVKLVQKVKRLLRRVGLPRWLHRFGPKRYEFWEHVQALLVMRLCRLSFRRVKAFFSWLGLRCPSKSALQYTTQRIPSSLWQRLLAATTGIPYVAAMDSTGLARRNPSYHYLRRVDDKIPKVPVKLSVIVDTKRKRFVAARIRVLPAHDMKDAIRLLQQSRPAILVADKAYDAERLHEHAFNQDTITMVPVRRNVRRGFYRNKMKKQFRTQTYHRRELVEALFSALKRTLGSTIHARKARTIRAELYTKLIAYNLFKKIQRLLGQSPRPHNL